MAFDDGDGYFHCPCCGNNGDYGTIKARAIRTATVRSIGDAEVEEVEDTGPGGVYVDTYSFEEEDILDYDDEDWEAHTPFYCTHCEKEFNEFDYTEYEPWEDEWRPECEHWKKKHQEKVARVKAEWAAREIRSTVEKVSKGADEETARNIVYMNLDKSTKIDDALGVPHANGFVGYDVDQDGIRGARLMNVGRELVFKGWRRVDQTEIRVWNVSRLQFDDDGELDAVDEKIYQNTIRIRDLREPDTYYYLWVPKDETRSGQPDKDNLVYITKVTMEMIERFDSDLESFGAELCNELTLYKCERTQLSQTLNVVFDLVPEAERKEVAV